MIEPNNGPSEAAIAEREAHAAIDKIEPVYRKGWTTVGKRDAHVALNRAIRLARQHGIRLAQEDCGCKCHEVNQSNTPSG